MQQNRPALSLVEHRFRQRSKTVKKLCYKFLAALKSNVLTPPCSTITTTIRQLLRQLRMFTGKGTIGSVGCSHAPCSIILDDVSGLNLKQNMDNTMMINSRTWLLLQQRYALLLPPVVPGPLPPHQACALEQQRQACTRGISTSNHGYTCILRNSIQQATPKQAVEQEAFFQQEAQEAHQKSTLSYIRTGGALVAHSTASAAMVRPNRTPGVHAPRHVPWGAAPFAAPTAPRMTVAPLFPWAHRSPQLE